MKKYLNVLLVAVFLVFTGGRVFAHCQIPCGIYDDKTQFTLMLEDVATIKKSTSEIIRLSKEQNINYNQIIRWVINKDSHSDKLANIITAYFMAQRVKPVSNKDSMAYKKYIKKLALLHQILILAMKAKQSTEVKYCSELYKQIEEFKRIYTEKSITKIED